MLPIYIYILLYIVTSPLPVTVSTIYTTKSCTKNLAEIRDKNATCAAHFFSFAQLAAKWRNPQREPPMTVREQHAFYLHAIFSISWTTKSCTRKKPFWSTIWTTKSCTRKDPSGARFGAQKVARENTHLEHDLEHKKLHAKTPIWSTIWCTKSCTRKDPFGARSGPQKGAREKTHLEHDLDHKKLHAKRPIWSTIRSTKSCTKKGWSRARSGPQKIARDKPIWSTEDSLEWAAASEDLKARRTAGFAQVQDTSAVLFFSSFLHLCN